MRERKIDNSAHSRIVSGNRYCQVRALASRQMTSVFCQHEMNNVARARARVTYGAREHTWQDQPKKMALGY